MDGRKTCKSCGKVVVKSISCKTCGIASHPACISRTGHPHFNGQFGDCSELSTSRASQRMDMNSTLLDAMKDLLHAEFKDFRREMRELYWAELDKLNNDIQGLCNRVEQLEGLLNKSHPQASSLLEDDIIEELENRGRRTANLIFYNMDEAEDGCNDVDLANEIIWKINPGKTPQINNILRLGQKRQGHSRPLRIFLPSKQEALFILRNKYRYAGL
ncbi:hypothetical protein EAG_00618 [Camponotus floridanus]|uniref:Uncharacterized protein n=1 Tax=Camponotus floridanus TaxID=104421 RepID=E2APQ7_CAMFO|nr:hypothetical protein EAG_00618 [Camponotus floridanus]